MSIGLIAAVAVFGALGAVIRYVTSTLFARRSRPHTGIFLVNLAGSALAGALLALPESPLSLAVAVGFCGSLTTFSTVAVSLVPRSTSPRLSAIILLALAHAAGSAGAALAAFSLLTQCC
jgi:fluoride exporter